MSTINSANVQVGQSNTPANNITLSTSSSGDLVVSKGASGALVEITRIKNNGEVDASKVGYLPAGTGAVATTVQDELRRLHVTPYSFGGVGNGSSDDTAAVLLAAARAHAIGGVLDFLNGTWLCTNLDLTAYPNIVAIVGQGLGTVKTKTGTTGTFFKWPDVAGKTIQDIAIDCNNVTGITTGLDTSWSTTGPSLFNTFRKVTVQKYYGTGWLGTNNNDVTFDECLVRQPASTNQLAFNITATGGLVHMENCIWSGARLRLAVQNYALTGCWGHGIEFGSNAVNCGVINGGYIYRNADTLACFSTQLLTSGTKIESMVLNGTWIDLEDTLSSVFKIRAAGKITLNACTIVPISGNPQLINASSVPDIGSVFIEFNGGRAEPGGTLGTAYPVGFVVVKNNFNNNGAIENKTSGSFIPQLAFGGNSVGMTTSNAVGRFTVNAGFCFFQILIALTAKGSSTGGAAVFGLPYTSDSAPDAVCPVMMQNVTYASGTPIGFVGASATGVTLFTQQSGGGVTQLGDGAFANNSDIRITGMVAIT